MVSFGTLASTSGVLLSTRHVQGQHPASRSTCVHEAYSLGTWGVRFGSLLGYRILRLGYLMDLGHFRDWSATQFGRLEEGQNGLLPLESRILN